MTKDCVALWGTSAFPFAHVHVDSQNASRSGNPVGLWRGGGSGPPGGPASHVGMCPEIAAVGLRRFEAPCRSSYVALAAIQARHHHADLNQHSIPVESRFLNVL